MLAERPWEGLPALLAPAMRPGLRALADEMIETIRATVPAYARPLEGAFAEGVRAGVEGALSQFLDVVEQGHAGPLPERELYAELGRGEAREGRSLEALLAAYRIGARVAWRRAAARARELELDDEMLALLAESIFAYIDELSAGLRGGLRARAVRRRRRGRSPPRGARAAADPAARRPTRPQIELAARDAGMELPEPLRGRGVGAARGRPHRVVAAARVARGRRRRALLRARARPRRADAAAGDHARVRPPHRGARPVGAVAGGGPQRAARDRGAQAGRGRGDRGPTGSCGRRTT